MKKFNLKAFTLVEMLIVIVIIGILIAALLPRMSAAQGRARDVARKTALSQIQSAIVTYQGDHGKWPKQDDSTSGVSVSTIETELLGAGMTDLPRDPLQNTMVSGLGSNSGENYLYMVTDRNGTKNGGFALMAKTEVPGGSNWVVCGSTRSGGTVEAGKDLKDVHPCPEITEAKDNQECSNPNNGLSGCVYKSLSELRYIITY